MVTAIHMAVFDTIRVNGWGECRILYGIVVGSYDFFFF